MSTTQSKTLNDFIQLQNRNAMSYTIRVAVRLGIIKALSEGQKTVQKLADELNLQPVPLRQLMDVLVQTELVEKYDQDFALATIARLIPDPYLDFGDRYWERLTEYVRNGDSIPSRLLTEATTNGQAESPAPTASSGKDVAGDADYFNQKATEEWMLTPIALDATQALDIGKSRRGLRILEIGSGSAVFAATMAHRDPDSVINLLDTPIGLERSRKTIDSIGLERQTVMIAAPNYLDLENIEELRDQTFDLVVLAGIIHRLGSADCQTLLTQVQQFIKPERELAIIDVFPGQPSGDLNRAIFELELGLRTSDGQLHDPAEIKTWLHAAGFSQVQYAHLPAPPHYWGLLVAEK